MSLFHDNSGTKTNKKFESTTTSRGLQPVDYPESLKTIAYKALHRALISGELKPGTIYREKELAGMLNISRTPVREALLELSAKGMVSFLPRKGIQIARFELRDLNEAFELRKALERRAIQKIAREITKYQIKELYSEIDKQRKIVELKDSVGFLQCDRRFHSMLSEIAGNRRLASSLEGIRDLIELMASHALLAKGRTEEVLSEHEEIVAALAEKDPGQACEKMEIHLEITREKVQSILFPETVDRQPNG